MRDNCSEHTFQDGTVEVANTSALMMINSISVEGPANYRKRCSEYVFTCE